MRKFQIGVIFALLLFSIVISPPNSNSANDRNLKLDTTVTPVIRDNKDSIMSESINHLKVDIIEYEISLIKPLSSIYYSNPIYPEGLVTVHDGVYLELNMKLDNIESDELGLLESILINSGSKIIQYYENNNFYTIATPITKLEEVKLQIEAITGVKGYEPNYIIDTHYVVDDPLFASQWGPELIGIEDAWGDAIPMARDIRVAILDTGIDYTHSDLIDQYLPIGYDFANDDDDPFDDHGHGTHVAGTIAASIDNGKGIAGMADVSIFAEKILDVNGSGYYSQAILGIEHAIENGATILSNSWGGTAYSTLLEDAVNYAVDNGALFIAASGNDDENIPHYPASYENAISVASTTSDDDRSWFSNYHDTVDISAPGSNILSTSPGNSYVYMSGTSMATPHVSGLAALIMSKYPTFGPDVVKSIIYTTSDDLGDAGYDIYFGHGRINASRAINSILYDDLRIELGTNNYFTNTSSTYYNFSITVESSHDVIEANLSIVIDNIAVRYEKITTISKRYSSYFTTDIEALSNISVVISNDLLMDLNLSNNKHTITRNAIEVTRSILLGEDGVFLDVSSFALVPVNLNISNSKSIQSLTLFVNEQMIANFTSVKVMVIPLLALGSNYIEIVGYWTDGGVFSTVFDIELIKESRIIDIGLTDQIVWLNSEKGIDKITFTELIGREIYGVINSVSGSRSTITDFKLNLMNGLIIYNESIPDIVPWIATYRIRNNIIPYLEWDSIFLLDSVDIINNVPVNKFIAINDPKAELLVYENNLILEGSDGSSLISSNLVPDTPSFELYIESPSDLLYNQSNELYLIVNNTGDMVLSGYEVSYYQNTEKIVKSKDIILYPKMAGSLAISLTNEVLGDHHISFNITIILYNSSRLHYTMGYNYEIKDLTPPELLFLEYAQSEDSIIFTWSAKDDYPDMYYSIINEIPIEEGKWHSGSINTLEYLPSVANNYSLRITIQDESGNTLQHTMSFNYTLEQEVGFLDFANIGFLITSNVAVMISIKYRKRS